MKRPPADTCCLCGRTIEQVDGRRMVATAAAGVVRRHANDPLRGLGNPPAQVHRIGGKFKDMVLCFWGSCWTEQGILRALEQAGRGLTPWICQPCAGYGCPECGAPHFYTRGGVLHDDGKIAHAAALPIGNAKRCINENCSNYHGGER